MPRVNVPADGVNYNLRTLLAAVWPSGKELPEFVTGNLQVDPNSAGSLRYETGRVHIMTSSSYAGELAPGDSLPFGDKNNLARLSDYTFRNDSGSIANVNIEIREG